MTHEESIELFISTELSPREQKIIALCFGLGGGAKHTLAEIVDEFGSAGIDRAGRESQENPVSHDLVEIVLAGSLTEFYAYEKERAKTHDFPLVHGSIGGMADVSAERITIIGTFRKRSDAEKLLAFARTRLRPLHYVEEESNYRDKIKDHCFSCKEVIPKTWAHYKTHGNFCGACCSEAEERVKEKGDGSNAIVTLAPRTV